MTSSSTSWTRIGTAVPTSFGTVERALITGITGQDGRHLSEFLSLKGYQVFGLIYDIHIDDDGLVRQLVTAEGVSDEIILDNRQNRNVPVEVSVIPVRFTSPPR